MSVKGTHRIKNVEPLENGVWVTDDTIGCEIPESRYGAKNYLPPIEALPWGQSRPGAADGDQTETGKTPPSA
jgi:hypothetical protein